MRPALTYEASCVFGALSPDLKAAVDMWLQHQDKKLISKGDLESVVVRLLDATEALIATEDGAVPERFLPDETGTSYLVATTEDLNFMLSHYGNMRRCATQEEAGALAERLVDAKERRTVMIFKAVQRVAPPPLEVVTTTLK